jgi:hypothetical protein
MRADTTKEWLIETMSQQLQRGELTSLQVKQWAEQDEDEIADEALRRAYADIRNRRQEPDVVHEAYVIESLKRGPIGRGQGNTWFDNWRRDLGITILVYLTRRHFGLPRTRNREGRRRDDPTACTVVSAALARFGINMTDKTVENISGKREPRLIRDLGQMSVTLAPG